jgi:hypothetical protein
VHEWEYLVLRVLPDGRWVGWENGVWRERSTLPSDPPLAVGLRTLSSEEALLRQLGAQGWELTGIVSSPTINAHRMYFKRPVRATPRFSRTDSPGEALPLPAARIG